jgi:hypothetical protein
MIRAFAHIGVRSRGTTVALGPAMRITTTGAVLAGFVLTACGGTETTGEDVAPILAISSPERGTLASETTIVVTGTATDDADGLRVTVNGAAVDLGADGSFSASVTVAPGLAIVETRAIDAGGHEARDVRAVLAGPLAAANGIVDDAIGARIGRGGLAAMSRAIADVVETVDFTAAGQAVNPVYDNGGCLGATVNITSIEVGSIDLGLDPTTGSLATDVSINDLVVRLHASYDVACIGGSSNLTIRADRVRIQGGLALAVQSGDLVSSLSAVTVGFTGFDLDVGGLPDAVVNLFNGVLDDRVASALAGVIRDQVPPLANSALAELSGMSYGVNLLGHQVNVGVAASRVTIDSTGAFIALDTRLSVTGGEGGMYLATPGPIDTSLIAGVDGIGLTLADDAVNELFAGLWAAGALDLTIPASDDVPVAVLLDDETASVDVKMSLPPTMSTTDDILHLGFGDLILTGRDANGEILQQFAVSITTTLAAATSPDGRLELAIGPPTAWAQVLVQSDRVERELDADQIEDLMSSVWRLVSPMASDALAEVPMPAIGGVTMTDAELATTSGFVVVRAKLAAQ